MRNWLFFSLALHVAFILIVTFGLPWTFTSPPPEAPPVILIDLAQIAEKTNAPPPPAAEPKPEPPRPEPPKPEPPKPDVKPEPPKPEPKPEPPKPEPPKPQAKPAAPPAEPAPDAKPVQKQAEVAPPSPVAKPKPAKEKEEATLDLSKLSALLDRKPSTPSSSAPQPQPPQPQAAVRGAPNAPFDPRAAVTQSDRDYIIQQIIRNWNVDCGKKDADKIVVKIEANYNTDGTLKGRPQIVDQAKLLLPGQEAWAAAAQAALRAVFQTQPLKFPPGDISRWNEPFAMTFDGRIFCGG